MVNIEYQTVNVKLNEDRITPAERSAIRDVVYMHDEPIRDTWDLYTALREARNVMSTVIMESNKYKYIRKSQLKANSAVFDTLERLVMEYVQK